MILKKLSLAAVVSAFIVPALAESPRDKAHCKMYDPEITLIAEQEVKINDEANPMVVWLNRKAKVTYGLAGGGLGFYSNELLINDKPVVSVGQMSFPSNLRFWVGEDMYVINCE